MKTKLPLVGNISTGKDADTVREVIKTVQRKEKDFGGFLLDYFKGTSNNNETTVGAEVLRANKGWVYRNTDVIAKEVATIEFELFSIRQVGQEIQFNPILAHPLLDLLDRFNNFTSSSDGFYITSSHITLAGDSFWLLEGTTNNITDIYTLPPDKVEPIPDIIDGKTQIVRYEYKDTIKGRPINKDYQPEDIIHFKSPNPNNHIRGLGRVRVAADDINTDWMAIAANQMIFRRGLIGNFILSTDKSMTDDQRKQLRAEFNSSYTGLENAFKVPIFSGGLEPKTIQMTNKDMEFIAQQEWVRDKITSIWGNNKAVIGVTDDVNRANAEATIENWKRTTISAEMKRITDTINEFLVPRFGSNLLLSFKSPVPEAKSDKLEEISKLIGSNVITPNEAREMIGLDPLKDDSADQLRESLIIPNIPKSIKNVDYMRVLRKNKSIAKAQKFASVKKKAEPLARKAIREQKQLRAKQKTAEDNKQKYAQRQIHIVEAAEDIFRAKVEKFIDRLVRKAIAEVPNEIADMQGKQLLDEEDEIVRAVFDFAPILNEVAVASGSYAMQAINSPKPYILKDFRDEIERRIELFASSMIQNDKDKLLNIITEGVSDGLSVPQIRRNITDTFETYTKTQAERITRTEVITVSNQAAIDAWKQSGVVEGKEWVTTEDDRTDDQCAKMNGKVVGLEKDFYGKETEFDTGDPPLHPNCRCVVVAVVADL